MSSLWVLILGAQLVITTANDDCGVSTVKTGRVIGGQDAKPGEWPWQAALFHQGSFSCGGSLIRPDWVLTASHCTEGNLNAADYKVYLGGHDINKATEKDRQEIQVKRIIMHESYDSGTVNNDIALLQLEKPAILNKRVRKVCLPESNKKVAGNTMCYITGWGMISIDSNVIPILQEAELPTLSDKDCQARSNGITPQMLCATYKGKRHSGCMGDSGGPLVCRDSKGKFVLQGVVSWGPQTCNSKDHPTVFARVSEFVDWIDKRIANPGKTPEKPTPPPPEQEKCKNQVEDWFCKSINVARECADLGEICPVQCKKC